MELMFSEMGKPIGTVSLEGKVRNSLLNMSNLKYILDIQMETVRGRGPGWNVHLESLGHRCYLKSWDWWDYLENACWEKKEVQRQNWDTEKFGGLGHEELAKWIRRRDQNEGGNQLVKTQLLKIRLWKETGAKRGSPASKDRFISNQKENSSM